MRVYVTGGSGFVGAHVVDALCARGDEVVAMARSDRSAEKLTAQGATVSRASLGEVSAEHLADCDGVIHVAARVQPHGARRLFWDANVEGTRRLIAAATEAGVRRFVHVSTEAVLFDGEDLVEVDETHPYPERHRFAYCESKAEAERLCLSAEGLSTIAIRPRFVWGPGDETILPQIARAVASGAYFWIGGGERRTSTTHVHNLVHGLLLALDASVEGAYFVADEGMPSMRSFLTALAATRDIQLPDRSISVGVARALAATSEALWCLPLPGPPPLARLSAAMMAAEVTVRWDKARQSLAYAPVVSVADGLAALRS